MRDEEGNPKKLTKRRCRREGGGRGTQAVVVTICWKSGLIRICEKCCKMYNKHEDVGF